MNSDPNLYLVTGASGFLGTALVEHLTRSGQRVRAMVRDERKAGRLRELGAEIVAQVCGVRRPWIHFPYGLTTGMAYLCEAVCRPLGIEPPLFPRRVRFYHSNRHFDSSKAKEQLGYEPAQDAKGEVEDIVASYREDGSFG